METISKKIYPSTASFVFFESQTLYWLKPLFLKCSKKYKIYIWKSSHIKNVFLVSSTCGAIDFSNLMWQQRVSPFSFIISVKCAQESIQTFRELIGIDCKYNWCVSYPDGGRVCCAVLLFQPIYLILINCVNRVPWRHNTERTENKWFFSLSLSIVDGVLEFTSSNGFVNDICWVYCHLFWEFDVWQRAHVAKAIMTLSTTISMG